MSEPPMLAEHDGPGTWAINTTAGPVVLVSDEFLYRVPTMNPRVVTLDGDVLTINVNPRLVYVIERESYREHDYFQRDVLRAHWPD